MQMNEPEKDDLTDRVTGSLRKYKKRKHAEQKIQQKSQLKKGIAIAVSVLALFLVLLGVGNKIDRDVKAREEQERFQEFVQSVQNFKTASLEIHQHVGIESGLQVLSNINRIATPLVLDSNRQFISDYYGGNSGDFLSLAKSYLSESEGLLSDYSETSKAINGYLESNESLSREISDLRKKMIVRKFAISRRFDTDGDGNAYYEAVDMDKMQKCIISAKDGSLSARGYGPISLTVESVGERPVTVDHHTAYRSYSSTEYFQVYKVTDTYSEISELEQIIYDNRQKISAKQAEQEKFSSRYYQIQRLLENLYSMKQ